MRRTPLRRYAVAVLSVPACLGLRHVVSPSLEAHSPLLPLMLAVLVAAWYGGFGPGILAAVLCTVVGKMLAHPFDMARFVVFLVQSGIVSGLIQGFHTANERLRKQNEDLVRSEATLRSMAHELQQADRHKNEFLAVLAHELRNSLGTVTNALTLIERTGEDPERRTRHTEQARRGLDRIAHFVDDVTDVSRVVRGKVQIHPVPVPVAEIMDRAVEATFSLYEQHGHTLLSRPPQAPAAVWADPTRLEQVLCNLLSNAAKYTPAGGRISLRADVEGGEVVFSVRDPGIGIPPEALPRIFDLFVQVNPGTGNGLGIGLTLVKNLVELQGGTVEARSGGPGQGSEFVVRLPLAPLQGTVDVPSQT